MKIWNVSPMIDEGKIRYSVISYKFIYIIHTYIKYGLYRELLDFLKSSRFTEKSALRLMRIKESQHDIEW